MVMVIMLYMTKYILEVQSVSKGKHMTTDPISQRQGVDMLFSVVHSLFYIVYPCRNATLRACHNDPVNCAGFLEPIREAMP